LIAVVVVELFTFDLVVLLSSGRFACLGASLIDYVSRKTFQAFFVRLLFFRALKDYAFLLRLTDVWIQQV
jgi:hypothetical protein